MPEWYLNYADFANKMTLEYLQKYFSQKKLSLPLEKLKEATIYSCTYGKKLRPILALESYLTFSGKNFEDIKENDDIVKFMIALELLHNYSLTHDDLPAMDNDEFRRGNLTTWKKFDEYTAILVGDLLNSMLFEILSTINDEKKAVKILKLFGESVGFFGMVGGQMEDMFFELAEAKISQDELDSLHLKKTGALITTSILGGAILAGVGEEKLKKLFLFGQSLGLAFQIKDDILDVEGTFQETGKSVGGEEKGYVSVLGLTKAKEVLDEKTQINLEFAKKFDSQHFEWLADFIKNRKK